MSLINWYLPQTIPVRGRFLPNDVDSCLPKLHSSGLQQMKADPGSLFIHTKIRSRKAENKHLSDLGNPETNSSLVPQTRYN